MSHNFAEISPDPEAAYDLIAGHYDGFTAHHDYDVWLDSLLPALNVHGLSGDQLLDAGCGTGKSSLPMLDRGWQVTACDNSAEMLERLRAKAGHRMRIEQTDLRTMPVLGDFDLILCLGDVLNYCAVTTPLSTSLRGLAANLAPDGLLLFDLNTVATYRTFFAEVQEVEVSGQRVTWRGLGDGTAEPGALAESVMEIAPPGGEPLTRAVHRQRHLSEDEVRSSMAEAGLECLDVFGQGFDAVLERPLEENRHTKTIYIARVQTHKENRR
ncbi:MAG TPA: class I SAM-dependent methyltransferase [Solirubrobacterales bacterium]|nr:class I SAM-dependent methyltransferase [Solirubrobacterales bacterium]